MFREEDRLGGEWLVGSEILDQLVTVHGGEDYRRRLFEYSLILGSRVKQLLGERDRVVVGVPRGGLIPARAVAKRLDSEMFLSNDGKRAREDLPLLSGGVVKQGQVVVLTEGLILSGSTVIKHLECLSTLNQLAEGVVVAAPFVFSCGKKMIEDRFAGVGLEFVVGREIGDEYLGRMTINGKTDYWMLPKLRMDGIGEMVQKDLSYEELMGWEYVE